MERLMEKVEFDTNGGCWLWTATALDTGYGAIGLITGKTTSAHRLSYELHTGRIPAGMCVMHSCDIPLCVNPAHLKLGTRSENMRDMVAKGRAKNGGGARRLTKEEKAQIVSLAGKSYRQISRLTNISPRAVKNVIIRHNEESQHG